MSKSEAARAFNIDRKTVSKILEHSLPPVSQRSKLDAFNPIIDQIFGADRPLPRK